MPYNACEIGRIVVGFFLLATRRNTTGGAGKQTREKRCQRAHQNCSGEVALVLGPQKELLGLEQPVATAEGRKDEMKVEACRIPHELCVALHVSTMTLSRHAITSSHADRAPYPEAPPRPRSAERCKAWLILCCSSADFAGDARPQDTRYPCTQLARQSASATAAARRRVKELTSWSSDSSSATSPPLTSIPGL